ncbi:hypothetical protein CE91St56_46150 [Lachnospiraceae bacterium]|nr:hypothetical protein CE91St56_46150 [Lachnospiraceae bacterium]GKH43567.1 hypothetical protein CE91St57_45410 [Lachnospiraceae bacterium]
MGTRMVRTACGNGYVTVHSVLCIYCTVREKVIQECINPITAGDFYGFMLVTGHGVNSNTVTVYE